MLKFIVKRLKKTFPSIVDKHFGIFFAVLIAAVLIAIFLESYRSMIFSAMVGFIIGKAFVSFSSAMYYMKEDKRKAVKDYDKLVKIYDEKTYGNKVIHMNGSKLTIIYDELYTNLDNKPVVYHDNPKNIYELDKMVIPYFSDLLQAHKASFTDNYITYRLKDLEVTSNQVNIYTERTTYYNHLATNRAIDFPIRQTFTIRKYFENGPFLTPLDSSKLSNQIGINAIIVFKDGMTIFPKRQKTSTTSKNKITSSLAIRLDTTNTQDVLTEEKIIDNLFKQMDKRLKITKDDYIDPKNVEFKLIGIGRDLCEGGKPQFYYLIKFTQLSSDFYVNKLPLNLCTEENKLDYDKEHYVCDLSSIKLIKGTKISISTSKAYYQKFKKKEIKDHPEMSFFNNLWHYIKVENPKELSIEEHKSAIES